MLADPEAHNTVVHDIRTGLNLLVSVKLKNALGTDIDTTSGWLVVSVTIVSGK